MRSSRVSAVRAACRTFRELRGLQKTTLSKSVALLDTGFHRCADLLRSAGPKKLVIAEVMVMMQIVAAVLVINVHVFRQPERHLVTLERDGFVVEREVLTIKIRLFNRFHKRIF